MDDNIKKLHQALIDDGYDDVGTEQEFRDYVSDSKNVATLYNALSEAGYDNFKDQKSLETYLSAKAPVAQKPSTPQSSGQSVSAKEKKQTQYPQEVIDAFNSPDNKPGNFKDLAQLNDEYQRGELKKPGIISQALGMFSNVDAGNIGKEQKVGGMIANMLLGDNMQQPHDNNQQVQHLNQDNVPATEQTKPTAKDADAITSAAPVQQVDAIYNKYVGKGDALSETMYDLMASGQAKNQEEAQNMAMGAMNRAASRLAQRTTDEFVSKLGDTVEGVDEAVMNGWHSHAVQDNLKKLASQYGIMNNVVVDENGQYITQTNGYDQFINGMVKPAMVESLVKKYGENYRKTAEDLATRLYSNDEVIQNQLMNQDIDEAFSSVISKYVNPSVVEEYNKAQEAGSKAFTEGMEGSQFIPANLRLGTALGAQYEANQAKDPQKILSRLMVMNYNMLSDPKFRLNLAEAATNVALKYHRYGEYKLDPDRINGLVLATVKNELDKLELKGMMPKGSAEYIMKTGLGNTIVGKITRKAVQTDYQNWLEDIANQQYQPGFWENVASGALTFAGDAWSYWLPGAAGGKLTKSMVAKAEGKLAGDLMAKGMERKMAERAAKVLIGKSKAAALKSGAAHGAVTFGGQSAISKPIDEIYRTGQFDENGKIYNPSVGKVIANTLGEVAKQSAVGAIMQGGTIANMVGKGRGLATNILADIGGKVVDSGIMTGQQLLERMAHDPNFKPTGKDAAETFLESGANLLSIGFPGFVGKYARFKDAREFNKKFDFTDQDIAELKRFGYDGLRDAFEKMGIGEYAVVGENAQRLDGQLTQKYMDLMNDKSVPEVLKAKMMAVVEGKRPSSFSPIVDSIIIQPMDNGGKVYLETLNKDGGIVERKEFSSLDEAQKADKKLEYEKTLGLASVLEGEFHNEFTQEHLEGLYNKAAQKYNMGEKLTDEDKAAVYLHQNAGAIKDIMDKQQKGIILTDEEQKQVNAYRHYYDSALENSSVMREFVNTFEDSHGVARGTLRKALESKDKKYAPLVESYLKELYNSIELKREMKQTMDDLYNTSHGNEQKRIEQGGVEGETPVSPVEGSAGGQEPPVSEGPAPYQDRTNSVPTPSDAEVAANPANSAAEGAGNEPKVANSDAFVMGQNAYKNGDSEALQAIDYNSDLATGRLKRAFADNEKMPDIVANAYSEGKDMDLFVAQRAGSLSPAQKDAISKYVEAMDAKKGAIDALQHADDGYGDALKEQLWPYQTEDGNIVPATLDSGKQVFLKKANEYGGAFVVVPDEQGQPTIKQVSKASIIEKGTPVPLDEYIEKAVAQQKDARNKQFISQFDGSGLKRGDIVSVSMEEGDEPSDVKIVGYTDDGHVILTDTDIDVNAQIDPKKLESVTKDKFNAWRQNALNVSIGAELDAEDAQRANDDATKAEAEKKQRFANGIVGLSEQKPDYSSKETDPKVAAEYLQEQYADNHDQLIKLVNGSRSDIKEQIDNIRKRIVEAEDWLDTNADLEPEQAQSREDKLKLAKEQLEDLITRYDNWNKIRSLIMTEEEKRELKDERTANIKKVGIDKEALTVTDEREVPVLTDEELKKQYPTMDEASDYILSQRKEISKTQEELHRQLEDIDDRLNQYLLGESDLTDEEIRDFNTTKSDLEARMANLSASAKDLIAQNDSLKKLYKLENQKAREEALNDMSPAEQRRVKAEQYLNDRNISGLAKLYSDTSVDFMDDHPYTVDEYVASSIGRHALNYEGREVNGTFLNGLQQEFGGTRKDLEKIQVLAAEGKGQTFDKYVNGLYDNLPDNLRNQGVNTQEIRNSLLALLRGAEKYSDLKNYILKEKIAHAEEEMRSMDLAEEEQRAAYEEEKEQQMQEQVGDVSAKYSLSSETAGNGEQFYQDSEGNIDLANVPQEVFEQIGYTAAPFRLTPKMIKHMMDRHNTELKFSSPDEAIDFVRDVMNNFDHVRLGYDGALVFSIEDGRRRTGKRAVTILINNDNGKFYGLKTSGYESVKGLEKRPLLWERGANEKASSTDAATASVTTSKSSLSSEQSGSASHQGNDLNSSGGKDTNNSDNLQEKGTKFSEKLQNAIAETETEPTEAQKKAGNYKKGHLSFGGYDFTVETPKGVTRSGKDEQGKPWSVTMHDTYGYILGKIGVDGDHIDMFINDAADLDTFDGNVYVVDQVNPETGEFDEHKVMYGYPDEAAATEAYLANYSKGWKGLGKVTSVPKATFDKWLESSDRKTKPFAEYAMVQKEQRAAYNSGNLQENSEKTSENLPSFGKRNDIQKDNPILREARKKVSDTLDELDKFRADEQSFFKKIKAIFKSKPEKDAIVEARELIAKRRNKYPGVFDINGFDYNKKYDGANLPDEVYGIYEKAYKKISGVEHKIKHVSGTGFLNTISDSEALENYINGIYAMFIGGKLGAKFYLEDNLPEISKQVYKIASDDIKLGRVLSREGVNYYDPNLRFADTALFDEPFVPNELFSGWLEKPNQKNHETLPFDAPMSMDDLPFHRDVKEVKPENLTEAQKVAYDAVSTMLHKAGIPVKVVSNEDMEKVAEAQDNLAVEMLLNDPRLRFYIKTPEQKEAAKAAYDWAAKNRPDKFKQYAIVNMDNPNQPPQYFEKKDLAEKWRKYYTNAWKIGNYKAFNLNKPFEEQIKDVKGDVPSEFDPYKAESLLNKRIELEKQIKETEDSYNAKKKERAEYQNQLMQDYMDQHGLSSENDIPDDVWTDYRDKSFEKYQDTLDDLFHKYVELDNQLKAVAEPGVQYLKGKGVVYGYTDGKQIVLNQEHLNPNTPIHEYQHLWRTAAKNMNPELIEHGDKLIMQTQLFADLKKDPNYNHLSDEQICDEAFARLTGEDGAVILEQMAKDAIKENPLDTAKELSVINKLKEWLKKFWYWTLDTFTKWKPEDIKKMTLEDIRNLVLRDLANGVDPRTKLHEAENVDDIKFMGSTTKKRMKNVASQFEGRDLDKAQQVVADVYSGKDNNKDFSFTSGGAERIMVMRQGNDDHAGTKHSLYRHFGVNKNYITVDDILSLPKMLNVSTRKPSKKGTIEYSYTDKESGVTYTVVTKPVGNKEHFQNFYSDRKANPSDASHVAEGNTYTPEGARKTDGNTFMAAKVDNNSETAKENGENLSVEDKIKAVSQQFGVDEADVAMYANAIKKGSTAEAARARANIKRHLLQANEDKISSFKELLKYTVPVNEALKENFGDVDAMIEERKQQMEAQRNAMEAARKRAEEEEAKRQKHLEELSVIPDDQLDKQYMDALAKGDDASAREMLDEAARRKGYDDTESAYQGVGAWAAPGNPGYESDKARRDDWESSGSDVNLEDIALGYTPQPDDYFSHPERYSQNTPHGLESVKAINTAIDAIKNGEKDVKVKVYRAVPTSVKEGKLRNGDWVTPSKKYAEMHGTNRLEGKYRIIEDEVPATQLWWDGNDANEFGFDDGKEYKYKNAKNNRKLNDLVTYDDNGDVIPPSKRFNSRKSDVRFHRVTEVKSPIMEQKLKKHPDSLMKAGTYFSGGGLVEEGLKGIIDPVVAVEYDRKISGVYRNNFGQHIVTADVRDVDPKELVKHIDGEVEYFHASPVCKNYSQAKSNSGEVELDKETAKSTADFIDDVKPRVVTIENVKGYKDSEAMKIITKALDKNGYTWDSDVYNAADYGGYTSRERLIIRAVKDGELPEKPKKQPRKGGWLEAVEDILPTLKVKESGVATWMDARLKADGIDWQKVEKPLYVMGSAYADGKIPHAYGDEILPTLRTKSGDVIIMPGGKVLRADGRVLARITGLGDDYKLPKTESLAHTIIGNGIPVQLTQGVIAPLLNKDDLSGRNVLARLGSSIFKNNWDADKQKQVSDRVVNTANKLGGAEATVYTSVDEVPDAYLSDVKNGATGWYDPTTHTVHVYLPNCADANEAERTVLHEKIGHEGMEVLLGGEDGVRKFANFVYRSVGKDVRGKIIDFANKYDPDWKNPDRMNVGTQEYIARLAEDGPKSAEDFTLWTKIKHYLIRLLKKLGIRVPGLLNDKDLRYYLMKAGKALHVWDEMPQEKQEAMMKQASNAEIKDALSDGAGKGKPRQKKGESTIQYMKRVQEWRKWQNAREDKENPEPPMFYDIDKDEAGKKEWAQLNKDWRERHHLVGEEPTGMPIRMENEEDDAYMNRIHEYEKWQAAMKDQEDPLPDMFAFEKKKQEEVKRKYEDWLAKHDLLEQQQADLDLYEGKIYPAETNPKADALEQQVMQDLAEVTSTDVSKEGAAKTVKHAVIHRRKNMEEASADDAIYINDVKNRIEKMADSGVFDKLLSDYKGKPNRAEKLAEAIPYIIEAPRRLRDLAHDLNATGAFDKGHIHIQPADVEAIQPYVADLIAETGKKHTELKDGKEVELYDDPQTVGEVASKMAQAINANHQGEEGFVPIDGSDILSEHVLPLVKQQIVPKGIDYKNLSPEMKSAIDSIRDWYNYTYDWLMDNHTLKAGTGYNVDYVNHIWDKEKSDKRSYAMYVENRQRTKSPNEKPRTISTLMEGIYAGLVPKTTDITKMMAYYSRSNIEAWVNKTMLQELSGLNVIKRNEDGEIISSDPLLSSTPPFNLEQYQYFEIPGVGPVWVYNESPNDIKVKNPITGNEYVLYSEASAGDRFGVVFETYQSSPFWKAFDTLASSAKKLELGFSGFHAGALTEVYMVQNMAEFGPKKAMANFMKYIFVDTAKNHELPCFANPEDFQEAASHLVKFGATNDYAAADVQNMFENMRDAMIKVQKKLKDGNKISGTVALATMPLKVATQMLSLINKGMDRALWDFLHDGLKLATYRMRADKTKERAKEKGWTEEELSRALDEDGQFVNDMFGGQHWDVLGASHRTLRYAGRVLLSPDWNASTTRHFLALTGFGSIWNEATFENFKQYYKRLKHKELTPEDEGRRNRQISALLCYGIGFMVFYEGIANGINAAFRALDEEKERKKAEEIRKTNPSYKSMYELAYGDEGMKWYDYLMRGNSLGQQSKIFLGRYEDGTEMYVRHGKQFREVPEYLFNHKGELEFPGPMVQRMIGKANPMVRMTLDDINYLSDFQASHADQEIQRKYGKTIGLLYKDALYWAPFLIPSQENKEFKAVDFFFPSSKGFSPWKAQSYFKDFILSGDMEGVVMTYQSCQRNGIDPEVQIKAAIGSVKALESAEMSDGVTSLQEASKRFDAAKSITEKKKMRQKMKKFLSQSDYKAFTQKEALDMVQGYLNGDEDLKEMEKAESKYLMKAKAEDVTEDWRIQNVWNGTIETYQEYQRLKDVDKAKANAFKNSKTNKRLFAARKAISAARRKMNKAKKQMDGTNDAAKLVEIRNTRKELLKTLNGME